MKRLATTLLVVVGLLSAASALALDLHQQAPQSKPGHLSRPASAAAALGCDDGVTFSGWFQYTDDRLGNLFDFGAGSTLSSVSFTHYDYSTAGPYSYNLEVWDPASCTYVTGKSGLTAASSVWANTTETVDLCSSNIVLAGNMIVAIDPNTCNSPTDCYPNLVFDDQLNVACPVIINNASTSPACYDLSPYGGPFLLRVGQYLLRGP